jgi:polyhydroxybutyrate depolymerase
MGLYKTLFLILGLLLLLVLLIPTKRGRKLPSVPGLEERTLRHKRRRRSFLLYSPPELTAAQRAPLVLVFHGGGGNAQSMFRKTGMHRVARRFGFHVVYPDGTGLGRRRLNWNAGSTPPQGYAEEHDVDDVGFIDTLLTALERDIGHDPDRVYATGISKGGMLAYRLACEMPERFAAIAPVAATLTCSGCAPRLPVAVLHIHGERDENVPLLGGKGRYTARENFFPPVWDGLKLWLRRNGCTEGAEESQPAPDTTCKHYGGGASGAEVVLCVVRGGGHGWPGTQRGKRQISRDEYISPHFRASEYIYRFFQQHSRRPAAARKARP